MRFDTKFLLANLLLILLVILSACSGNGEAESEEKPLAPESSLSEEILLAPQTVQEAYRFAIANPDILKEIPCYCGCGSVGHKNNYQCYVSEIDADGEPVFDSHALGWSICIDITRDVMRLLDDGKTVPEIRRYIDDTYARYGPSNMP